MTRNRLIVGLFAVLAAASAIGFAIMVTYLGRDACLDGFGEGASCPALAVVNGMRYGVGTGTQLVDAEDALTPYGDIERTNVPDHFAEMTAYSLSGIDPTAALVGNAADPSSASGPYVLMFGPDQDSAWPQLCTYLPPDRVSAQPECSAGGGS